MFQWKCTAPVQRSHTLLAYACRSPAQEHFLTALSQPRQEDRVDDALIEAAQPSTTVSREQLSTLKREREASRGFATADLFGRMVRTN